MFLRNCLGFLFLAAFVQNATAQSSRIDSLRLLTQNVSGTERADALNEYGAAIFSYDYLQAQKSIEEAYQLSEQLNYKRGMAQALIYQGVVQNSIGQDSLSLKTFKKSLGLSKQAKEKYLEGDALTYIGLIYQNLDRLDSAKFFYRSAYQILKDSANPLFLSFLYLNLAKFNKIENNQSLQLSYLKRSWVIRKKLKEKRPFVWIGVQLASFYSEMGNYNESLSYLDTIQKSLGRDTIRNEEINTIYKERAIVLARQGSYRAALILFAEAKNFYERNTYPLDLASLFSEMGLALSGVSNYETSLKYYLKALELAQANRYTKEITRLYLNIAWIYFELGQNSLAEEYCRKGLNKATTFHFFSEESSAFNLLGKLAESKNRNEEALDYFNKSLVLRKKNGYRDLEASTLVNIGILFEKLGDYNKAEEYELNALRINRELSNSLGVCESYKNLGQLYTKKRNFKIATDYLDKAELIAKKIKAWNFLSMIYRNQRELYQNQSNYLKAFTYSILYENVKDSLFSQSLSDRISTMQYDFQVDQKDKEIKILGQQKELQQKKLELQQAEIKQQRYVIAIGLFIFFNLCIGGFIAFRFYRKVRKLNREISEQNEEITAQSEELKEANQALTLLNQEISEQKEEIQAQAEELTESNETISRVNSNLEEKVKARTAELKEAYTELDTFFYRSSHDFRRPLTTFMGLAEVAKVTLKDQTALELFEKVNETARNLDKMLLKLQSVSAAGSQELIYSEVLLDQIFQIEMDNFREEIIRRSIRVLVDINLEKPFFSYPVLVKFIIQNLLENSIAFCGMQEPYLKFRAYQVTNETVLEVSDNGQGIESIYLNRIFDMYFRANEKSRGNGLGLYIVKKMVDKLNGRIELKSEHGFGTTVWVYLPNHF